MAKTIKKSSTPKPVKKKTAKQSSELFYSIIAASVKGNPKPKKSK